MENELPPSDEFPSDPEKRDQMKKLMPTDEEILEDLEEKIDRPYTTDERQSQKEANDVIGSYRAEAEKVEQQKLDAESLERHITDTTAELKSTYEILVKRLQVLAQGHGERVDQLQHLVELEWTRSQNEIQSATSRGGFMGMRITVPEARRRELLGALKHTVGVFQEIHKLIHPSESGQAE